MSANFSIISVILPKDLFPQSCDFYNQGMRLRKEEKKDTHNIVLSSQDRRVILSISSPICSF